MAAGGLPGVTVLLDDGTGTFPYDISSRARDLEGINGARGRQDELSQVTAPQPTLVLDNQDGGLSYGSTIIGSPSPILVDQQVRVKYTANATTVTRYTGTLVADNVSWPGGGDEFAIVNVTLADVQSQAERRTLRSVPEEEILLDSPSEYYTLGEPAGALSAADSSGNQQVALTPAGSGTAVVFGTATGPSTDGLTAATFAGGQYLATSVAAVPVALECYFATTTNDATARGILVCGGPGLGSAEDIVLQNGRLYCGVSDTGVTVSDGLVHHVEWQGTSVRLDGTLLGTAGVAPSATTLTIGGGGAWAPFIGSIAHVAAYSSTLSAARVTAHYQAGTTGFAGESGTARITRLAGYAGIPIGTLDTSLTNVPFVDITSKTAMAAIQEVVDAEFGTVYFDATGALTFHNRNRAVAKTTPDLTIDANQLDPGTSFFYDTFGILNYVTVTAVGTQVAQVAWNKVSEQGAAGSPKHGRYSDQKTYLVQTDAEALDRGNWLVNRHGQPAPRAGSLVVTLLDLTAAQQAAWLLCEPDYWVRVTGLPAQTPGGTTADLIVQGWAETLNATTWTLALNTSSRPAFYQALILDDATYGLLDSGRLYV